MPSFNLSLVASFYAVPYKLARTITTTTTVAANIIARPKCERTPAAWWRITPRAPLGLPAHDWAPRRKLGFCGQKLFSSSADRDMGSENKGDHWPQETPPEPHNQLQRRYPPPPAEEHQQNSAKLLTLPTILTIGRVAAVPLLVGTFFMDSRWGTTATTSIFIAAAITDWLDGYIARKMRLGSAFGAFLDPVADKLMVAATLVLLCTRPLEVPVFGKVPWLLTVPAIAIIGREITMSAVREWAASQNSKLSEAVAVNNLGKWKTATQMTALTILLATRDSSLTGAGTLEASGVVLLYISAWLAVWSLVVYMRKIWKVLLK
ncbi:CDP-diacylglycerol--glycerol-3-phosphate 3-phosphatidyltransferase 2-like [Actinidia eriantha]|uniref:CDP-diacylglycerol--glycerol-3-phosphate 3-phosphatidyltransferase 2-like n=1 Tax=Actinidia eriantha TaxID=165200 RepID=UPI002584C801|nr:CDP-diacylglycerol--glycerol-3-phosphate 3-phosphatidyltransferase 2-like [Actinidia eriantha]